MKKAEPKPKKKKAPKIANPKYAKDEHGLTRKQARFVKEYKKDLNAKQAAIRAGFSPKTAEQYAYQLLQKTSVREAIDKQTLETNKKCELTVEFVVNGLMENYRRAMQLVEVLDKEGNPTGEFEYEGAVANKSLELLGKHLAMFTDAKKVEITIPKIRITDASGRDIDK